MKKIIFLALFCVTSYHVFSQWVKLSNIQAYAITAYDSTIIVDADYHPPDIYVSEDVGQTWTGYNLPTSSNVWYLTTAGSYVYACPDIGIFRALKDDLIWSSYSEGIDNTTIQKICIKDSVMVAISYSSVYRRIEGDSAWTEICQSSPVSTIHDIDFSENLIIFSGKEGIAESNDLGLNWTSWENYNFEIYSVNIKGDTILIASPGGIRRKLISTGNVMQVNTGLGTAGTPWGTDWYGAFYGFYQFGSDIYVCGTTGIYKLSEDIWKWARFRNDGTDLAYNGDMLFTVDLDGVWGVHLDEIIYLNTDENNELLYSISVYPNPATDKIIVKLSELAKGNRLLLYNTNGVAIKSMLIENTKGEYEFAVTDLPSGLYVVALLDEGIIVGKEKIIIRK